MQNVRSFFLLPARQAKVAWSLGALVLFLTLQTFAASPSLHHFIHQDAKQPDHQCAVTLISHGQVVLTLIEVSVTAPVIVADELPVPVLPVLAALEYRLLPERAPPSPRS
jgi:hypothetical protein